MTADKVADLRNKFRDAFADLILSMGMMLSTCGGNHSAQRTCWEPNSVRYFYKKMRCREDQDAISARLPIWL